MSFFLLKCRNFDKSVGAHPRFLCLNCVSLEIYY